MPETPVRIYRDEDGEAPLQTWLDGLPREARVGCVAAITLLGRLGHELRRPHCENLGDGIYELRVKWGRVNLRMLYFFHGQVAVVLTHGFSKERLIPPKEIEFAKQCREEYLKDPDAHSWS